MNEWTTYRATCAECVYTDCDMKRSPGICSRFRLTFQAEADRYVSAKRAAENIGMTYDAGGFIFDGKPAPVKKLIREKLNRR